MDIQVAFNSKQDNDNGTQLVRMILTLDGKAYRWVANTPVLTGEELTAYLEGMKSVYALDLLYELYNGTVPLEQEGESSLDAWSRFISDGFYTYTTVVPLPVAKEWKETWD